MKGRHAFGTHMVYRETFFTSTCIFISSLSSSTESMGTTIKEALHIFTADQIERPEQNRDLMPVWTVSQRFNHLQWRRLFKELWDRQTTTVDFDLHFDKFPTPATFACWKKGSRRRYVLVHNSQRKQSSGSKKWSWLIQWMN